MENEGDFSKNLIENKDVIHKHTTKTIFLKNSGKQRRFFPKYSEKQKCPLINRQQRGFFVKKIKKQRRYPTKYSGKQRFLSTKYSGKQRRLPLITLGSKDDFSKNPGNHRRLLWNFPGNERQK